MVGKLHHALQICYVTNQTNVEHVLQTDLIGSALYFTTDDHGRPNQRVVSGPDGRKIQLPPSKKQWPSLAATWVLPYSVCQTDKLRQRGGK